MAGGSDYSEYKEELRLLKEMQGISNSLLEKIHNWLKTIDEFEKRMTDYDRREVLSFGKGREENAYRQLFDSLSKKRDGLRKLLGTLNGSLSKEIKEYKALYGKPRSKPHDLSFAFYSAVVEHNQNQETTFRTLSSDYWKNFFLDIDEIIGMMIVPIKEEVIEFWHKFRAFRGFIMREEYDLEQIYIGLLSLFQVIDQFDDRPIEHKNEFLKIIEDGYQEEEGMFEFAEAYSWRADKFAKAHKNNPLLLRARKRGLSYEEIPNDWERQKVYEYTVKALRFFFEHDQEFITNYIDRMDPHIDAMEDANPTHAGTGALGAVNHVRIETVINLIHELAAVIDDPDLDLVEANRLRSSLLENLFGFNNTGVLDERNFQYFRNYVGQVTPGAGSYNGLRNSKREQIDTIIGYSETLRKEITEGNLNEWKVIIHKLEHLFNA